MHLPCIYVLVRAKIISIITSAMAEVIIPFINSLLIGIIPSYFGFQQIITYFHHLLIVFVGHLDPSYFSAYLLLASAVIAGKIEITNNSCDDLLTDHVETLGGNGPKVAVYIRISKKGQSDFSIGGQDDEINSWKEKFQPSKIYWFFDKGKSSKSEKDFDKLKMKDIIKLKTTDEVTELWVSIFDRMGRVSRRLSRFYLDFSENGGIIRTSEKFYGRENLVDFVHDADEAEKANKNRVKAVKIGTIRSFKLKHWNKGKPPKWYGLER